MEHPGEHQQQQPTAPQQLPDRPEVMVQGEVVYHRQQPIVLSQQQPMQKIQRMPVVEQVQLIQQKSVVAQEVGGTPPLSQHNNTPLQFYQHPVLVGQQGEGQGEGSGRNSVLSERDVLPGGHRRHDVVLRPTAGQPQLEVVEGEYERKMEELKNEVERLKEKLEDAEYTISDLETKVQYQETGVCNPELLELRKMVSQICKCCHRYISDPYHSANHQRGCQARNRRGVAANPNQIRSRSHSQGPRYPTPRRAFQQQHQHQHQHQHHQYKSSGYMNNNSNTGHRGRSQSAGRTPPRRQRSVGRHRYW